MRVKRHILGNPHIHKEDSPLRSLDPALMNTDILQEGAKPAWLSQERTVASNILGMNDFYPKWSYIPDVLAQAQKSTLTQGEGGDIG